MGNILVVRVLSGGCYCHDAGKEFRDSGFVLQGHFVLSVNGCAVEETHNSNNSKDNGKTRARPWYGNGDLFACFHFLGKF